jgi:PAS domain S-box-containing protein
MYLSADGRTSQFLRVGPTCLAALGVPAEALLANSMTLADLVTPEDRERLLADKATTAAGRGPASVEVRIRKPSGELRWFRLISARRPAADGDWLLDGLMVDITESKRLAEQLAEERQRLEQAIELTGMGVFRWDRDDPDTVLWSEDQYAIYGVAPQTPITLASFRALVHSDDRGVGRVSVAAILAAADGDDLSVEHRIVRPGGEIRWVLVHLRVRRDDVGLKGIHGTSIDVTERRSAEEQRRLQMRELAHRNKNAMTVMMAMVQQAARSSETVDGLAELIMSRLLAMAKSQELATASEGDPLPLSRLTGQVLEAFDLARFELDPALDAVTVHGDAVISLSLLLHELATNAVKYGALSNDAGRIALSLQLNKDGWASVEWRERGGPPVTPPGRKGFGMRLLATVLQNREGSVTPSFEPEGFVARIEMPAA